MEEAPALDPQNENNPAATPSMRMRSVEEAPALDPAEDIPAISPLMRMGSVEEASALDPQCVSPDGAPNAILSALYADEEAVKTGSQGRYNPGC